MEHGDNFTSTHTHSVLAGICHTSGERYLINSIRYNRTYLTLNGYNANNPPNLDIWHTDHTGNIQSIRVRDNSSLTVLTKMDDRRVWSKAATGDLSKAAICRAWLSSGCEKGKMADGWREAKWTHASKSPTLFPAMSRLADYFVIVGYDHEKESK
jgi:hypothetical protein